MPRVRCKELRQLAWVLFVAMLKLVSVNEKGSQTKGELSTVGLLLVVGGLHSWAMSNVACCLGRDDGDATWSQSAHDFDRHVSGLSMSHDVYAGLAEP